MLRNVLGDYLDNTTERPLDLPLLALLATMGFTDIHYTHGQVEFGKDFIAKKTENGITTQYSFQSKAGNISQADWRNDIQGQILESVLTRLSHPNFDANLPYQVVLITSGDLRGNAALAMESLNITIQQVYSKRPIELWSRENLLDYFEQYGYANIREITATELIDYAQFFLVYGNALQGRLSARDIEAYTKNWLPRGIPWNKRLLRATIEAQMLAQQCITNGYVYEAITVHLGLIRVLLDAVYTEGVDGYIQELYTEEIQRLHDLCREYSVEVHQRWIAQHNLVSVIGNANSMTTYLVQCARIVDVTAITYFLTNDSQVRQDCASFIVALVQEEPGCAHPLSDRYTISLVLAVLVLCDQQQHNLANELLIRTTVWLCERYEIGIGLASFEATESEETNTLLGYIFNNLVADRTGGSFLASALCDLAAFIGNQPLYTDIVNDIKATHILPEYWQPADSLGICRIDGEDVVCYPNVRYEDTLTHFRDFTFADHIPHELASFQITNVFGSSAIVVLMVLLRDRYFPKLWISLAPSPNVA